MDNFEATVLPSSHKKRKVDTCDTQRESSISLRRWDSLDKTILKSIFGRVPVADLVRNVSLVCYTWQLGCWDTLFWGQNVLDLSAFVYALGNAHSRTRDSLRKTMPICFFYEKSNELEGPDQIDAKMMKLLKLVLEGKHAYASLVESWRLSLQTIFIPEDLNIKDEHLLYIAERVPAIECLVVMGALSITRKGVMRAFYHWKNVKHVGLGRVSYPCFARFVREIGLNCPGFRTLHVSSPSVRVETKLVQHIIKFLPKLRKLGFEAASLVRYGVNMILDDCLELEEFHLSNCILTREYNAREPTRVTLSMFSTGKEGTGREWLFASREDGVDSDDGLLLLQNKFTCWRTEMPPHDPNDFSFRLWPLL